MADLLRKLFVNGKPEDAADVKTPKMAAYDFDPAALAAALSIAGQGNGCVRLFVGGAVTHVGKTSVCLSLLASLRKAGIAAAELAYIKPATQCEAPDLLAAWCKAEGVTNVSGESAPLVFYSGFTRSFLQGEQGTSESWIERIQQAVDKLAEGRRVIIIDGVGFPSVGSIVGVDNADIAKACRAPVLLVCKAGVGAAVDSFSLNASYFVSKGVPVLGAVFNLSENEGFYSWDKCAESLKKWFEQGHRRESYYGVVPKAADLEGLREKVSETSTEQLSEFAELNAAHFAAYTDIAGIFAAAAADPWCRKRRREIAMPSEGCRSKSDEPQPSSRAKVTATALAAGAKGGG